MSSGNCNIPECSARRAQSDKPVHSSAAAGSFECNIQPLAAVLCSSFASLRRTNQQIEGLTKIK